MLPAGAVIYARGTASERLYFSNYFRSSLTDITLLLLIMKLIFGLVAGIGGLVDVASAHCECRFLYAKATPELTPYSTG